MCSYIGRSLNQEQSLQDLSRERRANARVVVKEFAFKLGLDYSENYKDVSPQCLVFIIVDSPVYKPRYPGPFNSKASLLTIVGAKVLFDDRDDVCYDVASVGVLPYHIRKNKGRDRVRVGCLEANNINHPSHNNLIDAINAFTIDCLTKRFNIKYSIVWQNRIIFDPFK